MTAVLDTLTQGPTDAGTGAPTPEAGTESWMTEVDEDAHAERRRAVKRAQKALEAARAAFAELGALEKAPVVTLFDSLGGALEQERPPEPRRCKEYLRAVGRARKGLMGISPDHVVYYCRCFECTGLRGKLGLTQPENPSVTPAQDAG